MDSNKVSRSLVFGYLAGFCTSIFNAGGAAFVQLLYGYFPPFGLNLGRYSIQFIICLIIIVIKRQSFLFEPQYLGGVVLIALLGNVHNIFYFTASSLIPLGNQMVVHQATMFISSAFVSRVFLKRELFLRDYILFVMVLLGGILVSQPDPPFHHPNRGPCTFDPATNLTTVGVRCDPPKISGLPPKIATILGHIFTVISAMALIGSSWVYRSSLQEISSILASFYYAVGGIVISIALMFFFEEPVTSIDYKNGLLFAGHCLSVSVSAIAIAVAMQELTPFTFSLVWSTRLVVSFIIQYAFGNVFLQGNHNVLVEVVGALLITLGTILSAWWAVSLEKVQSSI